MVHKDMGKEFVKFFWKDWISLKTAKEGDACLMCGEFDEFFSELNSVSECDIPSGGGHFFIDNDTKFDCRHLLVDSSF